MPRWPEAPAPEPAARTLPLPPGAGCAAGAAARPHAGADRAAVTRGRTRRLLRAARPLGAVRGRPRVGLAATRLQDAGADPSVLSAPGVAQQGAPSPAARQDGRARGPGTRRADAPCPESGRPTASASAAQTGRCRRPRRERRRTGSRDQSRPSALGPAVRQPEVDFKLCIRARSRTLLFLANVLTSHFFSLAPTSFQTKTTFPED